MQRLVVATAGGFGREVAAYARDAGFNVVGFLHDLDQYPGSLDGVQLGADVLGPTTSYQPREDELVAIGLGDVTPRREVAEMMISLGARLATVVHPTAWVAPSATIGEGVAIAPFAFVGPDARVGDLTMLNTYASVSHDSIVGRCCVFAPYAAITGRVRVEDEVFLATSAVVTPRKRVGARSAISAGSVVFDDVPADSLAVGNPAQVRPRGQRGGSDAPAPASDQR